MTPSALAAEVSGALRDFLSTGFGPSNPALSDVVKDFLDDSDNLLKGPYLSVDLPFQRAPEGGEPYPETPLGFTPYRHQRTAFDRLTGSRSTVIATGTGSGKTECFLYPVLDHCRTRAGTPGVKAIVIYPMNALASDQARRIAAIVDRTPSLRGRVTAGLYVGETGASPRRRMGADHLIENRDVLREHPSDILLTNYKMLDLLLTRPVDFPLWRHNAGGCAALSGGGRAAHVRRRARDGSRLPHPAAAGTASGGRRAGLRRHVGRHRRRGRPDGNPGLRVGGLPPAVLAGRRGRRGASGDRRISSRCHHQLIPRAVAGPRGADGSGPVRIG